MLGFIFDEKTFHDAFSKVMLEYTKKCDPDLPFYHYTGVNERFQSGCLPSFNQPSVNRAEHLDRVTLSRRADPGVFVANRAVIPQRGQLTVCTAHFRPAENLPPAPPPLPPANATLLLPPPPLAICLLDMNVGAW